MSLARYTEQELLKEIERRKKILTAPVPFPEMSLQDYAAPYDAMQSLIHLVEEAIDEAMETGYLDDDLKHYVYEAFIRLVYGEAFYEWSNNLPNL